MRTGTQDRCYKVSARLRQVLAIVEHEQQAALVQEAGQCLQGRLARRRRHPEGGQHRLGQEGRVLQRAEVGPPYPVAPVPDHLPGRLDRKARLAAASCAGQGHQAGGAGGHRLLQQPADLRQLALAADEARQGDGQVGERGAGGAAQPQERRLPPAERKGRSRGPPGFRPTAPRPAPLSACGGTARAGAARRAGCR